MKAGANMNESAQKIIDAAEKIEGVSNWLDDDFLKGILMAIQAIEDRPINPFESNESFDLFMENVWKVQPS